MSQVLRSPETHCTLGTPDHSVCYLQQTTNTYATSALHTHITENEKSWKQSDEKAELDSAHNQQLTCQCTCTRTCNIDTCIKLHFMIYIAYILLIQAYVQAHVHITEFLTPHV